MIYGSRLSSNVIKSICKTNRTKPRGVSCNACLSYVKAFLCHENLEDLFSKGKYRFNSREVRKCEDNFNEVAAELAQDRNENPYNYQAKAHNFGDVLSEKMGYVNLMDFKELLPMDTLENTPEGAFVVYGAERRIRRNDRFGHVELFTGSKWISDYENSEPRTGSLKTLSGNNRSVKGIYVKIELSPQELKDIDTYKDAYEGWQNLQSKLYSSPPDPVLEKPQRRTRRTSRSRK